MTTLGRFFRAEKRQGISGRITPQSLFGVQLRTATILNHHTFSRRKHRSRENVTRPFFDIRTIPPSMYNDLRNVYTLKPGFKQRTLVLSGTREQPMNFCASWTARHCDFVRISTRTNIGRPRANLNAFQHSDHIFGSRGTRGFSDCDA